MNRIALKLPILALALSCLFLPEKATSQASGLPLGSPAYHMIDRLDIKSGVPSQIHPELKFFTRKDAAEYAIALDSASPRLTRRDRDDLQYLLDDNNEWCPAAGEFGSNPGVKSTEKPGGFSTYESDFKTTTLASCRQNERALLGIFYRSRANFFEVNQPHFKLRANPMLNFAAAKRDLDGELLYANQRGIEVRGEVDRRVFFYTNFLETQTQFPDYVNLWVKKYQAVPGNGLYKRFDSKLFNTKGDLDFNNAIAHVAFPVTRHVGVELGHGRHFIGNGVRSLFLSDFSNNYFYLKLSTRVWRFHYQNLFMELTPSTPKTDTINNLLDKKYAAIHYLNFKVTPKLSFGLFEATVFHRQDHFEFQYLNPIILYRTVETAIGSPDNVLIGLDGRWNFLHSFQLYGQVLLDEFNFKYIYKPKERGWRANKSGAQVGLKYINAFGLEHLDLQVEANFARPYTYSHADTVNSYTHYRQPLAHPLGANFREAVAVVRYQPFAKLGLVARGFYAEYGENRTGENWGSEPLLSNRDFVQEFGNEIGQGVLVKQLSIGAEINWQFYHNMFLDFRFLMRDKDSADDARDLETMFFGAGLRMNLWPQTFDF